MYALKSLIMTKERTKPNKGRKLENGKEKKYRTNGKGKMPGLMSIEQRTEHESRPWAALAMGKTRRNDI